MTEQPALSFGEELRRERVVREIPLEEISAATKISMRLLKALEESDLARLPAPTFTRGFIRAYARHLGIDPEEKVNAYLADLAGLSSDAPSPKRPRPRSRFFRGRRAAAGTIVGGVTGLLLLLGLIANPERRPLPARERAVRRPVPAALKNVTVSSEPTPVIRVEPAPAGAPGSASAPADPAAEGGVSLLLEFDGDSWTRLEADGRTLLSGLVRRGESRRFEARDGFRLTLGNAGAVRVTVDGISLDRLGGAGQVVRDLLLPGSSARG
ncbi:MAG: helix-turn-helix domain-containing protein [Thermoanaerobaculia bacterium]